MLDAFRAYKSCKMIHTYKRKRTSLSTCSYYERLWGNPSAECSAHITITEDKLSNGRCYSKENEEAKCEVLSKTDLLNNSKKFQSEMLDAPPIKFKYTRRPKGFHKGGRILHYGAALPLLQEERRSISEMDTAQPDLHRLCCNSFSLDRCRNDAMEPLDLYKCSGGNFSCQLFTKEGNNLDEHCSNISANEPVYICASVQHEPDTKCRDTEDGSNYQNCVELGGTKWAAPLQTYSRRSRNNEDTRAERSNFVATDRSFSGSDESLEQEAVPKTVEFGESEIVVEHSPSFSQSLKKLTDRVSSVSNMMCGQVNQMIKNGCRQFDDSDVSMIPSLNDEAVTDRLLGDALKSYQNICDISLLTAYEECSTNAYEAVPVFDNSQNHSDDLKKADAASKDFSGDTASLDCLVQHASCSDKPSEVDLSLDASTKCQEAEPTGTRSEPLQQSGETVHSASFYAEDPKATPKERILIMRGGIKEAGDLFDINVQPSEDANSVSQINKRAYPVASINESAHTKILQLFPEDTKDNALPDNTSKSEMVLAMSSYSSSATVALLDLSVSREFIQDKVVESSFSQARHKLLLDGIRSCNKPQMQTTEGFRQNFQYVSSFWREEELDNLWVGVRRHGRDNWSAMLKDPRLQFSPWRTERDLAEMWIMEQTKLIGDTPFAQQDQYAKPVGILPSSVPPFTPPGPGFMTRFLTDPMQLSLNNAYLNKQGQGMYPPRPPHNFTSVPGNGTRFFNRRIRAHRKSQRSESSWGRFQGRNQAMPPPQFPTSLASTYGINILPSYTRDAVLPRLSVKPLSVQHLSYPSQLHDKPNNKEMGSYSQSGFHLSHSITGCSDVSAFPNSQPSEAKPTDPRDAES